MIRTADNVLEILDLQSRPSGNFTINHLIYLYPYDRCRLNIMEAFIDFLLNETLMDGQPFKIVAILTVINKIELTNLADIMSPYFTPIVSIAPLKSQSFSACHLSINTTIMFVKLWLRMLTGFCFS